MRTMRRIAAIYRDLHLRQLAVAQSHAAIEMVAPSRRSAASPPPCFAAILCASGTTQSQGMTGGVLRMGICPTFVKRLLQDSHSMEAAHIEVALCAVYARPIRLSD
ncbi:hypothetical protein CJO78_09050 [Ralstonia solanacearum]|nr:hypothetical protein LBM2029_08730 [Ralstonia solanacearum]AXV86441.1 hypothetical protein CJO78_09050 [Ralstonia solanacearum]AXW05944.1 hypothetical protein CJO82_08825 [Ralstonia solanacearum]AXW23688.1 hypothetical protein CJO86_08830 [Ralstonia solanacearum]AXW80620.1 hypothetical protein CJO98_09060 [Ralstonia solanacearum]